MKSKYHSIEHLPSFALLFRLLNSEGSPISFVAETDREARIYAAIASNVWSTFDKGTKNMTQDDGVRFLVVECEVGKRVKYARHTQLFGIELV